MTVKKLVNWWWWWWWWWKRHIEHLRMTHFYCTRYLIMTRHNYWEENVPKTTSMMQRIWCIQSRTKLNKASKPKSPSFSVAHRYDMLNLSISGCWTINYNLVRQLTTFTVGRQKLSGQITYIDFNIFELKSQHVQKRIAIQKLSDRLEIIKTVWKLS